MFKNLNKFFAALTVTLAFGMASAPAQALDLNGWKKAVIKKVAKKKNTHALLWLVKLKAVRKYASL